MLLPCIMKKARSAQPKVVLKSAVGALAPTSPERLLIADSVNSAPIYGTNMGIYFSPIVSRTRFCTAPTSCSAIICFLPGFFTDKLRVKIKHITVIIPIIIHEFTIVSVILIPPKTGIVNITFGPLTLKFNFYVLLSCRKSSVYIPKGV